MEYLALIIPWKHFPTKEFISYVGLFLVVFFVLYGVYYYV